MAEMPLPEAPLPPDDSMCCGNGCENCVWTVYQSELDAYRRRQAEASQASLCGDTVVGKSADGEN